MDYFIAKLTWFFVNFNTFSKPNINGFREKERKRKRIDKFGERKRKEKKKR